MSAWSKLIHAIGELIAGGCHRRRRHVTLRRQREGPPRADDGWSGVVDQLKHSIGPDPRPRHVVADRGRDGRAVGRHGKSAR